MWVGVCAPGPVAGPPLVRCPLLCLLLLQVLFVMILFVDLKSVCAAPLILDRMFRNPLNGFVLFLIILFVWIVLFYSSRILGAYPVLRQQRPLFEELFPALLVGIFSAKSRLPGPIFCVLVLMPVPLVACFSISQGGWGIESFFFNRGLSLQALKRFSASEFSSSLGVMVSLCVDLL